MDNLDVHARLGETFLLRRSGTAAAPIDGRWTELPASGWPESERASSGPGARSFQQSLEEVRREKQLQDVRREAVQRAKNARQRRQEEDSLSELREDRRYRRGPRQDRAAEARRDSGVREGGRPPEKPQRSPEHAAESRGESGDGDSKKCDDHRKATATNAHSTHTASRREGRGEQADQAKSTADGRPGVKSGSAPAPSGQVAPAGKAPAGKAPAGKAPAGKAPAGGQAPEHGKAVAASRAGSQVVPAEKPADTGAGRQAPAEEAAESKPQGQHGAKSHPLKAAGVSKKAVKGAAPAKARAGGNTQVVPDDGGREAVRVAGGGMSGTAKTGLSDAAKSFRTQPVPVARAGRQAAPGVHAGAKATAVAEVQQLEPGSQGGAQKQGAQADHFGGGHSASATVQGNAGADAGESVAQPFQHDLLQQIVDKAVLHLRAGRTELRIDLKPDVLGHLRLHISTDQQQVTLKILTESTWVKTMVEHHIAHLQAELQNHNLHIDRLDVSVAGDFQQAAGGNPQAGNPGRDLPRPGARPASGAAAAPEADLQPPKVQNAWEQSGLIDYFV